MSRSARPCPASCAASHRDGAGQLTDPPPAAPPRPIGSCGVPFGPLHPVPAGQAAGRGAARGPRLGTRRPGGPTFARRGATSGVCWGSLRSKGPWACRASQQGERCPLGATRHRHRGFDRPSSRGGGPCGRAGEAMILCGLRSFSPLGARNRRLPGPHRVEVSLDESASPFPARRGVGRGHCGPTARRVSEPAVSAADAVPSAAITASPGCG